MEPLAAVTEWLATTLRTDPVLSQPPPVGCSGRVYELLAPAGAPRPLLRYHDAGAVELHCLPLEASHWRLRLVVVAETDDPDGGPALALLGAVDAALPPGLVELPAAGLRLSCARREVRLLPPEAEPGGRWPRAAAATYDLLVEPLP